MRRCAARLSTLFFLAACGPVTTPGDAPIGLPDATSSSDGSRDAARPDAVTLADATPPRDGTMPDLGVPDLGVPDLAKPDLAMPDLAMPDLAPPPDLMVLPDLKPGPFLPSGCDITVNTNATGTVNPYVNPARSSQFYVSYAASPGDLMLATIDPKLCKTVAGPFQVNQTNGEVYFYGAQSVITDTEGNFYAVWQSNQGSHTGFAYSKNGKDFSATAVIDSTSQNGLYPSVYAVNAGHVHVAWSGLFNGKYSPFYSRNDLAFQGGAWLAGVQVTPSQVQVDSTAIAVDAKGNIYVAWVTFEGDVLVSRSTDTGKTWANPVRVNDVAGKAHAGIGSFMIVAPDGTVHVAWSDTRSDSEGDLYADRATTGLNFGADVMVADSTLRYQEDPSLAVGVDGAGACAGVLYAVWQDFRSNKDYDVYASRSTDQGKTWEKNVVATPKTMGDQMNPAIGVGTDCTISVSWRDSSANPKFDVKATAFKW